MYKENFGKYPEGDITKINTKDIPDFDILCAGFPCQPFSSAGKRKGFLDTRGTLFFEIERILQDKKPKMFILENVKGLLTHNNGDTFKTIITILSNLAYKVSYYVFDTKNFGVPQSRERVIIVGNLFKCIDLNLVSLTPIDSMQNFLLNNNTSSDIIDKKNYTLIDKKYINRQKSGLMFVGYMNKNTRKNGVLPNTMHLSRTHRQCNRIYSTNGLCPTLTAGETSGRYYIYDENKDIVRKLTIDECYYFMGFPKEFKKIGSKTNLYNRIGNSVCVNMIYEICKIMIEKEKLIDE
jgi:DNA (cytosine-5)-methyltransferase 1